MQKPEPWVRIELAEGEEAKICMASLDMRSALVRVRCLDDLRWLLVPADRMRRRAKRRPATYIFPIGNNCRIGDHCEMIVLGYSSARMGAMATKSGLRFLENRWTRR